MNKLENEVENEVEIAGVSFAYGDDPILEDVSLSVRPGALMAMIGPSGCGKTTLLRLLAGFERPNDGTISISGHAVAGRGAFVTPDRRRVGIVPQEGALFPHLDVSGNVGFGLARSGGARDSRIQELLDHVGLTGLGDRYPHELSGGQQQRVALARALAPRPAVVLLDEPFASLDRSTRIEVRTTLREVLRHEGTTAVLVTHDREEALSTADTIAVLTGGTVAQVGQPHDIYDHPASADVAGLLGDRNLIPVEARPDRTVMSALGLMRLDEHPVPASAVAVVRPERVIVTPMTDREPGVPAVVDAVHFTGPTSRLTLRLKNGCLVMADAGNLRPRPGDVVHARVDGLVHVMPMRSAVAMTAART